MPKRWAADPTIALIGEEGDKGFVPMTKAYDETLAEALRRAARTERIGLHEGVYVWFSGPSFDANRFGSTLKAVVDEARGATREKPVDPRHRRRTRRGPTLLRPARH